jgi:hypothetical protein
MKGELAGKAKKYMTWEQLESNCRELEGDAKLLLL